QEEGSHGWLIPLISAFVLWQRRERILAARGRPSWLGAVGFALGLLLLAFDDIAQLQRLAVPALILMGLGASVAALGWAATRYVAVPIAFLAFAMAPPGGLYVWLSLQLQFVSSEIGAAILQALGISVFLAGNVIDLGVYKLQVAEACSGLRYLFPLTALAFLCAWMYRAPLWAKAVVLASVIPITIATNSARIALVGVFVEYGSIARAEGFMHLFEGWVIFLVAMAMLFALMYLLATLRGDRQGFAGMLDVDRLAGAHIRARASTRAGGETARRLPRPWLACVVVVALVAPAHVALMNRPQITPDRPGLATFPLELGPWQGEPATIDAYTEDTLGSSDYLLADYVGGAEQERVNLWVTYFADQVRSAALHTPQQCLPGAGWEFVTLETADAPVANHAGEPFRLNRAVVTNNDQRLLIYYWLEARGEQYLDARHLKYGNLWSSVVERRSDGGLVRLTTPIQPGESVATAEARLVGFMEAAYPRLEPHLGD
ncbi:MAG: VPLPA-CTERM-specific exosortase XrtD, partial [Alphaproteobacteria bacterium]